MSNIVMLFQYIAAMALGGAAVHELFGLRGIPLFVFGAIPGFVIHAGLMAMFPRAMTVLGTLLWAWTGYATSTELGADMATVAAVVLLLGAIGGYANFSTIAENGWFQRKQAKPRPSVGGELQTRQNAPIYDPTDSNVDQAVDLEGYDRWQLVHGLDHLLRARAIRQSTYNRAIIQLPIEYARVAPNAISMASLEREEVTPRSLMYMTILHEAGLISNAEREAAVQVIETQIGDLSDDDYHKLSFIGEREEGAQRAAYEIRKAEANGDYLHLSGVLFELVYCRAISIETFRRAIVEADPGYDLSYAKIENFPYEKPRESAEQDLKQLLSAGFITRGEREQALKVIAEARRAA